MGGGCPRRAAKKGSGWSLDVGSGPLEKKSPDWYSFQKIFITPPGVGNLCPPPHTHTGGGVAARSLPVRRPTWPSAPGLRPTPGHGPLLGRGRRFLSRGGKLALRG